ncbi:DUF3572 domain-containing protein [Aestuariibius sp. 2305UL40-4]|uniref:DUF3572 domain-containing protein n=1 Tax=Aestuariibius violaceus TaxID=3234132 RepID=UPI0034870A64
MTPAAAETIALEALAWIVSNDDLRDVFMGAGGVSESDLRQRIGDPDFQLAVLDFLLMDDRWITAFCDAQGHAYDVPMAARHHLPGGEQVHWT